MMNKPLPFNWEYRKIKELVIVNPKIKNKIQDNTPISFLGMSDLSTQGRIIHQQERKYSDVKKGFTTFRKNDVLIAKITPCFENGKGTLISGLKHKFGFGSTEFHVLRSNQKILPYYLQLLTKTNHFRSIAIKNMTGSAVQKRVPIDFIKNYSVLLPPLQEQEKIAKILEFWDRAIELLERLIEKKKKKFRYLLMQLYKINIKPLKIKDIIEDIGDGGTPSRKKKEYFGGNIPWVVIQDINIEISHTKEFLTEEGLKNSSAKLWPKNSIILSTGASIGKVGINLIPLSTKQGITGMIPNQKINSKFLMYYFMLNQNILNRYSQGSSFKEIRPEIIKNLPISVPDLFIQNKIVLTLDNQQKEIDHLKKLSEKYSEQKRGLMQKLLTGEWRVCKKS